MYLDDLFPDEDLKSDVVLSLRDVPTHLPRLRGQRKVHISTVFRWAQRGTGGRKLQTWRLGGRRVTTLRALKAFIEPVGSDSKLSDRQGPQRRERQLAKVEGELAREGF